MRCEWLAVLVVLSRAGALRKDPTGLGKPATRGTYGGFDSGGFAFYRSLRKTGAGTRRVFGGAPASEWTPACVLLDPSLVALCSGAVLAPRWALTAAHCARPGVAYVRYRGRSSDDDLAAVHRLYAHPEYKVKHADEGAGLDVVLLHHDVGLVRTRRDMTLEIPASSPGWTPGKLDTRVPRKYDPIRGMAQYSADSLLGQEVEMLGYGRSERAGAGAALRAARVRVAACQRGDDAWRHCACALGNASGVCSGDSGGPVVYQGRQIGVTSMGPLKCAASGGSEPGAPALSVFTTLRPYVRIINATINEAKTGKRMRAVIARASSPLTLQWLPAAAFAILLLTTPQL